MAMTFSPSNASSDSYRDQGDPSYQGQSVPEDWSLVFTLIDRVLPFEACLYHQILPLSLQGNRLFLGMVNLEDAAALEYARRILQFLNYRLIPRTITSETHHNALSVYLNHTRAVQGMVQVPPAGGSVPPVSVEPAALSPETLMDGAVASEEGKLDILPEAATAQQDSILNTRETLVLEIPEDLQSHRVTAAEPLLTVPTARGAIVTALPPETTVVTAPTSPELTVQPPTIPYSAAFDAETPETETRIQPIPPLPNHQALLSNQMRSAVSGPPAVDNEDDMPTVPLQPIRASTVPVARLPLLDIHPQHLHSPLEVLKKLSPQQLLVELLGRSLTGGIGRLFFTRKGDMGQVLWSESGVLQSVVDELPLSLFETLLQELKQLLRLSPKPITQPHQVEIERMYQRERLLLRLRIVPKPNGEEATLQVLRGSALKFYQQQQLVSISRDTLNVAQELQRKVSELHDRARNNAQASSNSPEGVPELDQMINYVEMQLTRLKQLKQTQQKKPHFSDPRSQPSQSPQDH
ncbi:MAG: hypothetical protein VKJ24_04030 [Synechococcales bacterium]|nr:hypothetical protein [Synechococcales bacterium]